MNDNLFHGNVGLKYHAVGAVSVGCMSSDGTSPFSYFNITSGHYLAKRNATDQEKIDFPEIENWYADSINSVKNVTDYFDPNINYTIAEYMT